MWPMVGFTTLINAIFAVLIGAAYWFGGAGGDPEVLINLLFYIIITPVLTVTLGKIMYGGENQMIVEDALKRTDGILSRNPLPEAEKEQNIKDHSIVLQNVSFRYEMREEMLCIRSISISKKESMWHLSVPPAAVRPRWQVSLPVSMIPQKVRYASAAWM